MSCHFITPDVQAGAVPFRGAEFSVFTRECSQRFPYSERDLARFTGDGLISTPNRLGSRVEVRKSG
jgi:hypothetical protein